MEHLPGEKKWASKAENITFGFRTTRRRLEMRDGCRSDGLTKTSDDPTLILNFKIFCEANKQEIEIVTV
jgi:hypothetical protein